MGEIICKQLADSWRKGTAECTEHIQVDEKDTMRVTVTSNQLIVLHNILSYCLLGIYIVTYSKHTSFSLQYDERSFNGIQVHIDTTKGFEQSSFQKMAR